MKKDLVYKITPDVFIVEYNGNGSGFEVMQNLSSAFRNQIKEWEPLRIYKNSLQLADLSAAVPLALQPDFVRANYYAESVEDSWNLLNVSGDTIVIGVADVGINTNLLDLTNNIEFELSEDFVQNRSDMLTPWTSLTDEVTDLADHGNRVASIVAAEKGNDLCSSGIAFKAKIAALRTHEVGFDPKSKDTKAIVWTAADILGRALVHRRDDIHIIVNAWSPIAAFDPLDLTTSAALEYGTAKGRKGLGRIYLVPAGPAGNSLSHNINTITIGGIGQFGRIPSDAVVDSSVITCGLTEGNNINSSFMVTTSSGDRCITGFSGLSAATAQVAGIIALGLQANPYLTLRDILHLLVESSEHVDLQETKAFKRNKANRYYHPVFGFGLLNCLKFVRLAKRGLSAPELVSTMVSTKIERPMSERVTEIDLCFSCSDANIGKCVNSIEYVDVWMNITTDTNNLDLKISVISPFGTDSLLMNGTLQQIAVKGKFLTPRFWDEMPNGIWTIRIQIRNSTGSVNIDAVKMTFTGSYKKELAQVTHRDCERERVPIAPSTRESNEQQEMYTENNKQLPLGSVWFLLGVFFSPLVLTTCFGFLVYKQITSYKRQRNDNSLDNSVSN